MTINFIQSEGKEIQKHLIKIGPFTLLLVFAGQNILYTYAVADPGPLMLGVLDRWTPTVNILQTQIAQISFHVELCPIEAGYSISLYTTPLSIWLSGFGDFFFNLFRLKKQMSPARDQFEPQVRGWVNV